MQTSLPYLAYRAYQCKLSVYAPPDDTSGKKKLENFGTTFLNF
jgi:hypothetical protein